MSRELEQLLREARELLPLPAARATMRAREAVIGAELHRRTGRLRATGAVVVLLLATVVGVGVGLLVAPLGGASSPTAVSGLGFLPAKGWTVVQATPEPAQRTTALAANVPIDPRDVPVAQQPFWTVSTLPDDGIVVFATFTTRGNVWTDHGYPEGELPVLLDETYRETSWNDQIRPQDPIAQYRHAFANGGYNVDVRVYVGSPHPSRAVLAQAQRQLDRLIVAAEPLTIQLQPNVVAWGRSVNLSGAVGSGRAGEEVEIEERWCGSTTWSRSATLETEAGGGWHSRWGGMITTSLRARSKGSVSRTVVLRVRPGVTIRQAARSRFVVGVLAMKSFWQRRGVLERYDRARGRWVTVRRFTFTDSGATTGVTVGTEAEFRARVRPGTLVRAVLPRTSAGPCYLAGYSNLLQTRR